MRAGLTTKGKVKMAGYWQVLSLRFMESAQKDGANILSHLDQTSLNNKMFIIWAKRELLLAKPTREIPGILPGRVANQNPGFASSCPLAQIQSYVKSS